MAKTCECGCERPAMPCCGRCDSRECNAGCIMCRPRDEWDIVTITISERPLFFIYCVVVVLFAAWQLGARS
jgi:hypothetical protein